MNIFNINQNPFGMILIILPLLTFIVSFLAQLIIKKKIIVVGTVFIGYLIAMVTIFNHTFQIWVYVYTAISFLGTCIADWVKFYKDKNQK